MRNNRRRDASVVVDHLLLGKSRGGIEHLLQVRQLQMLALNLDSRIGHMISGSYCARNPRHAKYSIVLKLLAQIQAKAGLTTSLPSTYFQTSALQVRPTHVC